tara:strand:+ start:5463 stop:5705 length:243 start_codon:yes stop_codon:yes gene_type:complete
MPKQNASAATKRKRVTFSKKNVELRMEDIATRALANSHLVARPKQIRGILKKSSYKGKKKARKNESNSKKRVRYRNVETL